MKSYVGSLSLMLFLFAGCASNQTAKDSVPDGALAAAPAKARLVMENEYLRAVEVTLAPGQTLARHRCDAHLAYAIQPCKLVWTVEGRDETHEWAIGEMTWQPTAVRGAKNIGENEARFLVVTRKAAALPHTEHQDAAHVEEADPQHVEPIWSNDHMEVIEIALPPRGMLPTHQGEPRLIYSLNDYRLKHASGDTGVTIETWVAGEAHWHGPSAHSVENIGDTEARYLVVILRK